MSELAALPYDVLQAVFAQLPLAVRTLSPELEQAALPRAVAEEAIKLKKACIRCNIDLLMAMASVVAGHYRSPTSLFTPVIAVGPLPRCLGDGAAMGVPCCVCWYLTQVR